MRQLRDGEDIDQIEEQLDRPDLGWTFRSIAEQTTMPSSGH
jgi:hypothetical protein